MSPSESSGSINELLDRAVRAINDGDRATANALAGQVLSVDRNNREAEDLLTAPNRYGEIRRLAMMFVDLVDSTALSTRVEPETYHMLVGRYRDEVLRIIAGYEGHVTSIKGDGVLAVFGHPKPHDNDVQRAVGAGLDISRAVAELSKHAERRFGVTLKARGGIHRGVVYLDTDQDDVYGFAANLAARLSGLAEPGTLVVSDTVEPLVRDWFELTPRPPAWVKGVDGLVAHHQVLGERPAAPAPRPLPLVGRDRERHWLQQCWQQARFGCLTKSGVIFRGEAGIGKTRLAIEAAALVKDSGGTVIELRGSPLHTDTGLHPVRRLVERRCGITRLTDGAERLRLLETELRSHALDPEATVPLLAPVVGLTPEHGVQPAAALGRTLYESIGETVHRYVLACLDDGPGLIIAEDVHWFDPSTLELLNSLLTTADRKLMVVATGRDGDWTRSDWSATIFDLTPLTGEQSDALIEALDPAVSVAQRAAVRDRCDGVPFYIEHVVAGLDGAGPEPQVPEALYESLFARLHTRTDVVPVIEAAAVIGRGGDLALLCSVVGHDAAYVDEMVVELERAGVLERRGTDRWRFRHELFREVATELAPPSLREDLHARAARALVDAATDIEPDWLVVAAHFEQAALYEEAVAAYQKASVDARRRGAVVEAHACLSNAIGQIPRCAEGPERDRTEIIIRLERGFLRGAIDSGASGEGPADFERCLQLADPDLHEHELFLTLIAMVNYYMPRAELRRAHELLDSLSNCIPRDWKWSYPAIESSRGTATWLQGDFAAARKHLLRALAERAAADPGELDDVWWIATDPITSAHNFMALSHVLGGDLDRANAEMAEAFTRSDTLSYPQNAYNRAFTHFTQIWVCLETSRVDDAAVQVAELRRVSEQSGLDLWQGVGMTQRATIKGLAALRAGADAPTLAAKAEKIAAWVDGSRLLHLNIYLPFHDAVIGRLLIAAGQPQKARERLETALQHTQDTGMHFHDAELMRLRAHTLTDTGARRAALGAALELARYQGATLFEMRCLLDAFDLLGDGDRSELADVVSRFPGDARWPERQRAESILR